MESGVRIFTAKAIDVLGLLLCLTPMLLVSCSHSSNDLSENKTFQKVFTESEINDLQRLFDFFNESICESGSESKDCYQAFFTKMEPSQMSGEIDLEISFEKQQNVYQHLEGSTFYEIWDLGRGIYFDPLDTLNTISLQTRGKFFKFLKEVAKGDRVISFYAENLEKAGGMPPSMIAHLLKNYEYYKISDVRVRFIIAIHYLTLNDFLKRKEKYLD